MKYFILAGEASGDLHASNLIKALLKKDPQAEIQAWGGDLMEAAGATIQKHISELAFMGFAEVLLNIRTILGNFTLAKKQIEAFQPDKIIFVDYPGFNLRMAKWSKEKGYHNIYYIAPQAWAWKENRVEKLKTFVDEMYVILPFEKKWFNDRGVTTQYFGHPLMDTEILDQPDRETFLAKNKLSQKPIIALLPGSRAQELSRMSKVFIAVAKQFSEYQFVVAGAPGKKMADYTAFTENEIGVVFGSTYPLLHLAEAALVTSGTATLETAIIGTPLVVCYRASKGTYWMAKSMIQIKYISLVNLILDRGLVPELIQGQCNAVKIGETLSAILLDSGSQIKGFEEIRGMLGETGVSDLVASRIEN